MSNKSRRSFLKNAALLSTATAFPAIWNNGFANRASGKVNLACIGIGNQGGSDVMSFAKPVWPILLLSAMLIWVPPNPGGIEKIPRCATLPGF